MTGSALCFLILEMCAVECIRHEQGIIMECDIILVTGVLAVIVAFHADRVIDMRNYGADFSKEMLIGLSEAAYLGLNIAFYADTAVTVDALNLGMG